jgi:hypothetical protein
MEVEIFPVIQPCPAQVFFIGPESEFSDEMEGGSDTNGQSSDIPCVGGNFRFHQDDMNLGQSYGPHIQVLFHRRRL